MIRGKREYMDKTLEQKMKEEEKTSIIIGIVFCTVLCIFMVVAIVDRVIDVNKEGSEISTWLNFGIIVLFICFLVVFIKYILLVCLDSKKGVPENYENIKIKALQVKTKMSLFYGTWRSEAWVENIETGEQFSLKGCGDMKENEIYCLLRAKHSKLFVYEILKTVKTEDGDLS